MFRKVILSAAVVLLSVSAVQAQIPVPPVGFNQQYQDFDVALGNLVSTPRPLA